MPITVRHDLPGLATAAAGYAGGLAQFTDKASDRALRRRALAQQAESAEAERELRERMQEFAADRRRENIAAEKKYRTGAAETAFERQKELGEIGETRAKAQAKYRAEVQINMDQDRRQAELDQFDNRKLQRKARYEEQWAIIGRDGNLTDEQKRMGHLLLARDYKDVAPYKDMIQKPRPPERWEENGVAMTKNANGEPIVAPSFEFAQKTRIENAKIAADVFKVKQATDAKDKKEEADRQEKDKKDQLAERERLIKRADYYMETSTANNEGLTRQQAEEKARADYGLQAAGEKQGVGVVAGLRGEQGAGVLALLESRLSYLPQRQRKGELDWLQSLIDAVRKAKERGDAASVKQYRADIKTFLNQWKIETSVPQSSAKSLQMYPAYE